MATRPEPRFVTLGLRLIGPPAGVAFAVQRGKAALLQPFAAGPGAIEFRLPLRLGEPRADGSPVFLGEFAQGPPDDRFVYVTVGQRAGQPASPWDRRAKLKLAAIDRGMVDAALADPACVIEAGFPGTMKDGSPVCATLPAGSVAWRLLRP